MDNDDELLRRSASLHREALARSEADGLVVSTVRTTIGHRRLDGAEYETALIAGDNVRVLQRYYSEAAALTGHSLWVALHLPAASL